MILTLGTHNTHDGTAPATGFAKVLIFTEAVDSEVRAQLGDEYHIYVCKRQKDLVIALHKSLKTSNVKEHYRFVVPGWRKVTPRRGVYWLTFDLDDTPMAVVAEHRINAAFPPFVRGERGFRSRMWKRHTRIALKIIKRLLRKGRLVLAGGDLNTPRQVLGYDGVLIERGSAIGHGYDRLGSSKRLTKVAALGKIGSDHNRIAASLEIK